MKGLEKILLATESCERRADTVRMAVALARAFQSEILLVHVLPEIHDAPIGIEEMKVVLDGRLQAMRAEIAGHGVRIAEPILAVGAPFNEIIEAADAHDVNVIMVGSGETLGLTAEKLIRKARQPVWVVKAGAMMPVRRILCPVDFSEPARRGLTNAIHLARAFQADLEVLTVIQPLASIHVGYAELADQAQMNYEEARRREFDEFLAGGDFHDVRWAKTVRRGLPHEQILEAAREQNVDLLVMGSTGRTGLARILIGSVAEKVVREMPCSVITVKAEHAIRLRVEQEIIGLEAHLAKGRQLLKAGLATEAVREFQQCLDTDMLYIPAWEGLATAHQRLGHAEESERCRQTAQRIAESHQHARIQAAVRAEHPFWGGKL